MVWEEFKREDLKKMSNTGYMRSDRSAAGDECLTPRYGVTPIVKYLKARGYNRIWCPFDESHSFFVRVLKSEGFEVIHGHIDTGSNFFEVQPALYDCIVSNPPFSKKDDILKRLYELEKPFAIILPQNALQSLTRVKLYMRYNLELLGFDRRINYYIRGDLSAWKPGNHFASAYFCRDVLPEKLIFETLKPVQEPYYDLEDML